MTIPCPLICMASSLLADINGAIVEIDVDRSASHFLDLAPHLEPLDDGVFPFASCAILDFKAPHHILNHSEKLSADRGLPLQKAVIANI